MVRSWVVREIIALTWERLVGRITQGELEQAVRNLVEPDPQLELGVGGTTEAPGIELAKATARETII